MGCGSPIGGVSKEGERRGVERRRERWVRNESLSLAPYPSSLGLLLLIEWLRRRRSTGGGEGEGGLDSRKEEHEEMGGGRARCRARGI